MLILVYLMVKVDLKHFSQTRILSRMSIMFKAILRPLEKMPKTRFLKIVQILQITKCLTRPNK